jgi:hypothetical protein
MSKEHRIPLRKIRCMTKDCYKKIRKVWMGRGYPSIMSYASTLHIVSTSFSCFSAPVCKLVCKR